jgi:hypothetical protein
MVVSNEEVQDIIPVTVYSLDKESLHIDGEGVANIAINSFANDLWTKVLS